MSSIVSPPNPFLDAAGVWRWPAMDEIFFLPGDWTLYALARHAPSLAAALDVGPADYGSAYAGVLALWFWLAVSLALIMAGAAVRSFDRLVTMRVIDGYRYLQYRFRMLRALAEYRRRARERVEPTLEGEPR